MKKCLLLIAILIVSQSNILKAQSLIIGPDTVCVNQPVQLSTNDTNQYSYYWGFCSGSLNEIPTWPPPVGTNEGNNFGFHIPANIDIIEDSGVYYGFVVNSETTEFLRLNYGNSLANEPTVTNFGNLNGGLPINPTSLYILKDSFSHNWYIFVSGGFTYATSQLGRIDFGPHLSNPEPNIANFGNFEHVLNGPKGIFVAEGSGSHWWGYVVNHNTNELIQLDFSFNVSNTPLMYNLGAGFSLSFPTDLAATKYNNNWYMFVTNEGNNTVSQLFLGTDLDTTTVGLAASAGPISNGLGLTSSTSFNFRINVPSSICVTKDCGNVYAYVTDSITDQLIGIQMDLFPGSPSASAYTAVDYNNVGAMNHPSGISNIIRDGDNLFGFVCNAADSTLSEIEFKQCTNSSIPSYSEVNPPAYSYDTEGVYNVYFVTNQGLPTMQVQCKTITVIAPPPIFMNNDTTICQGDTIRIHVISNQADSIVWAAASNIDTTNLFTDSVRVYPNFSTSYGVTLYYPFGCIVDTTLRVNVINVTADAGPDRYIMDGATTILGGPNTSTGNYIYTWTPFVYLSDSSVTNPAAYPPTNQTYYLTVTAFGEGYQCTAKDTVNVFVTCGDIVLPNAFAPNSENSATATFGIINKEISQLNYFRIFDRWGVQVFQTTNALQGWDGTYNGVPAPVGVYVWEADAFCANGLEIKKSGNVMLLR